MADVGATSSGVRGLPATWAGRMATEPAEERRVLLGASAVALVVYGLWWRGAVRLAEAPSYERAGQIFASGWHSITERPPGYPLLLWATGSLDGPSLALFAIQLLMVVATSWLVWSVARRAGFPLRWRVAVFLLALSPPVAQMAAYAQTECLAALLITGVLATGVRARTSRWAAVACGALAGAVVLVRPAFLLVAPLLAVALVAVHLRRGAGPRPAVTTGALLLAPWLLLVGGYTVLNGARFGQMTITPLLPWHLSTTTASSIESLPPSFEPLRSELIAERDRQLLVPESGHTAELYVSCQIWNPACPRHAIARRLGVTDQELSREMLRAQLWLVVHDPQTFVDRGTRASGSFALPFVGPRLDPRPAPLGSVVAGAWWLVLALASLVAAAGLIAVAAAAWLGRLRGRRWLAVVGAVIVGVTWFQSAFFETGDARLRTPVDPVLLVLAAVGLLAALDLRSDLAPGVTEDHVE